LLERTCRGRIGLVAAQHGRRSASPCLVHERHGAGPSRSKKPESTLAGGAPVTLEGEGVHLVSGDTEAVGEHLGDPRNWMPSVWFVCSMNAELKRARPPPRALLDIGARVIDSTPHAMARS